MDIKVFHLDLKIIYNRLMKSFKWHGIPVNVPSTRNEWIAISVLLGLEAIVLIVIIVLLFIK